MRSFTIDLVLIAAWVQTLLTIHPTLSKPIMSKLQQMVIKKITAESQQDTLANWLEGQFEDNPQLNQTGLALQLGIGQSTISHWLKGVSIPSPQNCQKLARFFNIPEDALLILAGHKTANNDNAIKEPTPTYYTGPRAHLHKLIDSLTFDQARTLETFLATIK